MSDNNCELKIVESRIVEHINAEQALLESSETLLAIEKFSSICRQAISNGGTIFFMGNGGSAADSQHLAAELVAAFRRNVRDWHL